MWHTMFSWDLISFDKVTSLVAKNLKTAAIIWLSKPVEDGPNKDCGIVSGDLLQPLFWSEIKWKIPLQKIKILNRVAYKFLHNMACYLINTFRQHKQCMDTSCVFFILPYQNGLIDRIFKKPIANVVII